MGSYRQRENDPLGAAEVIRQLNVRISALERTVPIKHYTTVARPAAAATNKGWIIYNTTTNKHQGSNGSAWNDLY